MEAKKTIGIWMDHSSANFIDLNKENNDHSILSKFTFDAKEEALNKSESVMQNKEQQMHESFYKEISDEILRYDHVLLFGPTNAKAELNNYLNKDLHFKDKKIDIEPADKMSANEKISFVRSHFKNNG